MKLHQYKQTFVNNDATCEALRVAKEHGLFILQKEDKNIIFVSLKRDINNYLFSLRGDTDKQDRIEYLGYEDFTGFAFYAEYADETLKNKDVAHSHNALYRFCATTMEMW